ncbi:MAG: T9SS type A sorting domain-containing protein [Bacteroidia bacterium]
MKHFLLLCLLGCSLLHSQELFQRFDGQDTIWGNALAIIPDSSVGNIWQIGPPQKAIMNRAFSLPNALLTDTINTLSANDSSRFYVTGLQNSLYFVAAVRWAQILDYEEEMEGGMIEFSGNSGREWRNIFGSPYVYNLFGFNLNNVDTLPNGELGFTGTDSTWKDIWLCFDGSWLSLQSEFLLRFTSYSDTISHSSEGWALDNLAITQTFVHTINGEKPKAYMSVYPNPSSSGIFQIETQRVNEFHIIETLEVHDAQGRLIQSHREVPIKFYVDLKEFPDGIYTISAKTNLREKQVFEVVKISD